MRGGATHPNRRVAAEGCVGARAPALALGPAEKKKGVKRGVLDSFLKIIPGDDLLSHTVTHAVPSAPKSLTSEFGMGSGMASSISLPENF